uniref:Uncharacterized protein n=1 Tax=Medicago truncatula TaxID=3880 RepID=Q1STP3_MEDTR|nr:hypothetical protein MtrDRAFT_AC136139g18v2 [Medicago truncatula]
MHEAIPDFKVRTASDPFVWIIFVANVLEKNRTKHAEDLHHAVK